MKKISLMLLASCLVGCSTTYDYPTIVEYGVYPFSNDGFIIDVKNAEPGMIGYETKEDGEYVYVIFKYHRKTEEGE